ncbi:hypothetical protein PG990_001876 [Apiospora arundinis]
MDEENPIPSFVAPGANKALAVCAPPGALETDTHGSPSPGGQDNSHLTLASLVANSTAIEDVGGTVNGVNQLDDTDGPDNMFVIPPPPAHVRRPAVAAQQRAQANQIASKNYGGNRLAPSNLSADIPDNENCSLFIRNLPPG